MFFTTREKAEAELRSFNEEEPEEYLRGIKVWGEDEWNHAIDNTPAHQVFEIGEWLLREHLNDCKIEYVMIDDELKSARRLAEELG